MIFYSIPLDLQNSIYDLILNSKNLDQKKFYPYSKPKSKLKTIDFHYINSDQNQIKIGGNSHLFTTWYFSYHC